MSARPGEVEGEERGESVDVRPHDTMTPMRVLPRAVTLSVLIVWVLFGPIGMAFDGCAAMGGMCEGPCAPTTTALAPLPPSALLPLVEMVTVATPGAVPAVALAVPDLPPKSPHLAV